MYFILSKVLLFLITPFFWVSVLLVTGILIKKPQLKKRFFISSAVVFLLFSNPFLFRKVAGAWNYPPTKITGQYSCAILLGGFVSETVNGKGFFNESCDRFIKAAQLKANGTVSHILVSSGNGRLHADSFREADWVRKQLLGLNFADTSILVEHDSRNTLENAEFSNKILLSKHLPPPYVLVTGTYHMRRAMYIFKQAGIPVIPYPAEFSSGAGETGIEAIVPSVKVLWMWNSYIKEMVGYIVTWFKIG